MSKSCHESMTSSIEVVLCWYNFNAKKLLSVYFFTISRSLKVVSRWYKSSFEVVPTQHDLSIFIKKEKKLHLFNKKWKKL